MIMFQDKIANWNIWINLHFSLGLYITNFTALSFKWLHTILLATKRLHWRWPPFCQPLARCRRSTSWYGSYTVERFQSDKSLVCRSRWFSLWTLPRSLLPRMCLPKGKQFVSVSWINTLNLSVETTFGSLCSFNCLEHQPQVLLEIK